MELPRRGLITYTWGNVSGIDRESGYFVIKPSGVDYDKLTPDDMVVMDLEGNKIEGDLKHHPTHQPISNCTKSIRISEAWYIPIPRRLLPGHRQEGIFRFTERPMRIISLDRFHVHAASHRKRLTRHMRPTPEKSLLKPLRQEASTVYTPGVLCTNHGPFTWGKDAAEAVHNAVVLEEVAKMATRTELINRRCSRHRIVSAISISSASTVRMLIMDSSEKFMMGNA